MNQAHKDAIGKALKGHKTSEETKRKIGLANRGMWVKYLCDECRRECEEKQSHYNKSKTHFCDMSCFKKYQKRLPFHQQNAYRGVRQTGESKQIYHRRYVKNNPEVISHLKARRYARERGAEGSHTLAEWEELKARWNHTCCVCRKKKILTKDHIQPLSLGGTDYIYNIQPMCRNCNSQKWAKTAVYTNPELLS